MQRLILLVPIFVLLCASTPARAAGTYLKRMAECSEAVIVAKVIRLTVREIRPESAQARILEVLKGDVEDTLQFSTCSTATDDISDAKMGETAILFLRRRSSSRPYELMQAGRGRFTTTRIGQTRYAQLPPDIIFPRGIIDAALVDTVRVGDSTHPVKRVDFEVLLGTIKNMIAADPLLWPGRGGIVPPTEKEILDFRGTKGEMTNTDRIAIYEFRFVPGLDTTTLKFMLGEPSKRKEDGQSLSLWKYKHFPKKRFLIQSGKLLDILGRK